MELSSRFDDKEFRCWGPFFLETTAFSGSSQARYYFLQSLPIVGSKICKKSTQCQGRYWFWGHCSALLRWKYPSSSNFQIKLISSEVTKRISPLKFIWKTSLLQLLIVQKRLINPNWLFQRLILSFRNLSLKLVLKSTFWACNLVGFFLFRCLDPLRECPNPSKWQFHPKCSILTPSF